MSSFASVVDLEKNPRPGYTYTDKDWDPVTLEQGKKDGFWGYHASKTFAERAAWDIWKEAKPEWDLVTFCPPMVYGIALHISREVGHVANRIQDHQYTKSTLQKVSVA